MEGGERSLEALLAELLAGDEAVTADGAPADSFSSQPTATQLQSATAGPAVEAAASVGAEPVAVLHVQQQQQQPRKQPQQQHHQLLQQQQLLQEDEDDTRSSSGEPDLDALLINLLAHEQQHEQQHAETCAATGALKAGLQSAPANAHTDAAAAAPAGTAVPAAAAAGGGGGGGVEPWMSAAADDNGMLIDLLDVAVVAASRTAAASTGPASSTAAASSALLIDLPDLPALEASSDKANLHANAAELTAAAAAALLPPVDTTTSADRLTPAAAAGDVPKQAAAAAAAAASGAYVSAASVSSELSDDMLDMLHDMAEVLEEGPAAAAALEQDAAATLGTPAAPPAAAAGAEEYSSAAHSAAPAAPSTVHQLEHALQHNSSSLSGEKLQQQQQQQQQQQRHAAQMTAGSDTVTGAHAAAAAAAALPPHELALQQAWQYEEMLYHGGLAQRQQQQQQQGSAPQSFAPLDPSARLTQLLSDARSDWNPAGRPAAHGGAMIGGAVLLKLESLAGLFAGAAGSSSSSSSSSGGGASGVDWGEVLAAALAPHGPLQVVAASGPYLAVGTASGSALVFQLPQQQGGSAAQQQGGGAATPLNPSSGHQPSALPGGAAMWQLGEGLAGGGVTCLGFSVVSGPGDALWLGVGHVSGALTVWELQKRGPRQVAGIGQHGSRLTLLSFFPSRSTTLLLSGDLRGRLCLHTFSSLLLRTTVGSRVLASGQYGPLLGVSHLTPFALVGPGPSSSSGGGGGGGGVKSPRGVGLSPRAAAGGGGNAWRAWSEDASWRVGDGVFCLTTPTHVYIARLKPNSQDLLMLFSIPQPTPGAQAAVPVAAWLPHVRKGTAAGLRVWPGDADGNVVTNGVSNNSSNNSSNGSVVVPVAALALGWGSKLVMFDVPLVGDHVTVGEPGPLDAAPSTAGALAAAAGQLRRGAGSLAAAAAGRAAQRAAQTLEALTPTAAAQLAAHFPLSISGTWSGGTQGSGTAWQSGTTLNPQGLGTAGQNGKTFNPDEPVLGPAEPLPILGVHWLDVDAIAVVCQQGFSSLLLVLGFTSHERQQNPSTGSQNPQRSTLRVQEQVEWMDQPVGRQWAVSGGLTSWGLDCAGGVVGSGPRMYLLGEQGGVFCGRLMPWSERLKTLQDARKFKLGLYFAMNFRHTMQQQEEEQQRRRSSYTGSSSEPQAGGGSAGGSAGLNPRLRTSIGGLARSEGLGAEPQQLEQWMLSLMLGHATKTLQEAAAAAAAAQHIPAAAAAATGSSSAGIRSEQPSPAVAAAAEIAVCICLLLDRPDVLFSRVYPTFAQPPPPAHTPAAAAAAGSVGGLAAFIHVLEAAILSDLLQVLDPAVMQALVQYFTSVGQPERVEGCVLHLSITSLDLDQVIRVCEGSGLYSALAYIHTAIGDPRKPLLDLLAAVAGAAGSRQQARGYAYKLLVYLRCCFRGLAFPPGAGSNTPPTSTLDSVKATLLGTLLFATREDLLAEWKQSGGRAAATAAAVTAAAAAARGAGGATASSSSSMCCGVLSDPHPGLQLLLAVDVAAVVSVLSEATAGWDAAETDLRAAAGKHTAAGLGEAVLVATQVVVNAFVALLEAGKFEQWQSSSSSSEPSGSCVAMDYIIDLLAAGRVTVKPAFVLVLLQHLSKQAAAAANGSSSSDGSAAAAASVAQLEEQFISIINVVGVSPPAVAAAAAAVRQQQQQQQYDAASLSPSQAAIALQLAAEASFVRATAAIHHLAGNYAHAIAAYVQLTQQQQQQQGYSRYAGRHDSVFDYIERFLSSSQRNSAVRQQFMSCVLQQAVQLIQLNPTATAVLLLRHQPDQQVPVLVSLQQQPLLQFQFLQAAMQQAMLLQQQAQQAAAAADVAPAAAAAVQGFSSAADQDETLAAAATAGAEKLLERAEVADLYVRLLVQFEPEAVMQFLQAHHNYNVAAAIKACAAAGVSDAEAFLHERMGDLEAALQLYLAAVHTSSSKLAAALLAGNIPVLHVVMNQPEHYVISQKEAGSTGGASDKQIQWGLGWLLQQLQAVHDNVKTATAAAAAGNSGSSSNVVAAAAAVAAAMLQLLSKGHGASTNSSSSGQRQHYQQQQQQWLHHDVSSSGSPAAAARGQGTLSNAVNAHHHHHHRHDPPHPHCSVYVDLHKAWMSELSPRLRLKGLGATAVQPSHTCGQGFMTLQHAQSAGLAAAAAAGQAVGSSSRIAAAAVVLPAIPEELLAVWKALQAVLAFCQRNTKSSAGSSSRRRSTTSSSSSSKQHDDTGGGKQLWYGLMDVFVDRVRSLQTAPQNDAKTEQQQQQQQHTVGATLLPSLAAAAAGQVSAQELPAVLLSAAAAVAAAAAHDLFSLLLDEVVACVADYLPLLEIVGRVLQQHGGERIGEFRWTLMGLFGATAYESAIMTAANRLITCDAFTAVRRAYLLRQLAREPVHDEQQQQQHSDSAAAAAAGGAQASSSAAAAAGAVPVSEPPPSSLISSSAVDTASMLGLLRHSNVTNIVSNTIYDIMSDSQLQLQPAGPAAGHLRGVAAEYRAAAAAARSSRRVYKGEVDLAAELAALNKNSMSRCGSRQGGGGGGSTASQQQQIGVGKHLVQHDLGTAAAQSSAAAAAAAGRNSFDLDELLMWSQKHM